MTWVFTANQYKKVIDVANHLTIYCDAFGQLCNIFNISGGNKILFVDTFRVCRVFVNIIRYLSTDECLRSPTL